MAIKNIVVPITGNREAYHLPLCALKLAEELLAHVTATSTPGRQDPYFVPDSAIVMGNYATLFTSLRELEEKRRALARTYFDNAVAITKTSIVDTPICRAASTTWVDSAEIDGSTLLTLGRLADLIVVDQPVGDDSFVERQVFEESVFTLRKPVLMLPRGITHMRRAHVAIAWNGSLEAITAVERAMDILEPEAEITIIQAGEIRPGRASIDELTDYLGWHCYQPTIRHIADKPKSTGAAILQEAKAANADLLIVGAYSHTRMRELMLGGVTRHLLEHTNIPLFMAH